MPHRNVLLFSLLAVLATSLGCDDEGGGGGPYAPGSLTAAAAFDEAPDPPEAHADLFAAEPYGVAVCDAPRPTLTERRELRVFVGPGVRGAERFTRGLQRWFRRHGLEFYTRHVPLDVPLDWALDLDRERLARKLSAQFEDVDFTSAEAPDPDTMRQIEQAAFSIMLAPVVDFAEVYGQAGGQVTHVVLLPRILRKETWEGESELVLGLAMSPTLLRSFAEGGGAKGEGALWSSSPLGDDFTPMMFINAGLLSHLVDEGLDEAVIDLTMAHEFGHTLGLHHVDRPGNLMKPGLESEADLACSVKLDDGQMAVAEATLTTDQRALALLADLAGGARAPAERWRWVRDRLAGAPLPIH